MNKFKKFIFIFIAIFLFVGIAACGEKAELSFKDGSVTVLVGETVEPELTIKGKNLVLEWSSEDDKIAKVNDGIITGVAEGETNVTVKVKDKDVKATIKVSVVPVPEVKPNSIIITGAPSEAKIGGNVKLEFNVIPKEAKQEVVWSSSDDKIATVDQTGKVEFKSKGSVVITAKAVADNNIKKEVTIQVVEPDPTEIVVSTETGDKKVMLYGTLKMKASVNPEIAIQTVTWSVNDPTIASINEQGILEAKKVGKVEVIATSTVLSTVIGKLEIEVVLPAPSNILVSADRDVIQVEEELQLVVKVMPDLALQDVVYSSSDEAVATVSVSGKVVGVAPGSAVITVKSAANENVIATLSLTVIEKIPSPTHSNFLVDASLATQPMYTKVTFNDVEYILGINAFADFASFNLSDESVVFVKAGVYEKNFKVNKNNVIIKSANADKDPHKTFDYLNQAIIKGKITIADGVEGLVINGLSFTGAATIEVDKNIKDFKFINNHVFDTTKTNFAFNPLRDYNQKGFITLWKQGILTEDILFENNKFNNVSQTNIIIGYTNGLTIKNNTFTNFDREAIRIEGGYNQGLTVIEDNKFIQDEVGGYVGIYFRAIGDSKEATSPNQILVKGNFFKNIGKSNVEYSAAISSSTYQEFGAKIDIVHNRFESCTNFIMLRVNVTPENLKDYPWVANINYNIFLGMPEKYFHKNKTDAETGDNNPHLANLDYNFFGDLDGNPFDLEDADVLAKFQGYGSLKYTFLSIEAMYALFVNPEWEGKADNEEIIYEGMKFEFGVNAFASIADALEHATAGQVVIALPGEYSEEVLINKSISLRTLNSNVNPTDDDSAFKDEETAAVVKGVWYIENVSNVSIKGFSFTLGARVRQFGPENAKGTSNFLFENNYIYDTNEATIAWKQDQYASYGVTAKSDTTVPGFLTLAQFATWMKNYKIMNNKFENVSDTHINMICAEGVTITGNMFIGGDRDGIRLDYASLNGVFNIKDNVFEDLKYNGIYIRTYAVGHSPFVANIEYNVFKNIGEAGKTETPTHTRIGAIATRAFSEANSATFNIKYNIFENNVNYITLRNNVSNVDTWATKPHEWKAFIEYNAFISETPVTNYFKNLVASSDTNKTNVDTVYINNNFYGSDENTKVDITEAQFDLHKVEESNTNVYDTLADLLQGIEDYFEFIKEIVVDPELAEVESGTIVVYNGQELKVGKSAFAKLADAVDSAVSGKTIRVLAGEYTEDQININVNNLTILGPNANVDPNTATRKDEALITSKVVIGEGVTNLVINGFQLKYDAAKSYVVGHENGNIDQFYFLYNDIIGGSGDGSQGAVRFKQADATKGISNVVINYNRFTNMNTDRVIRIAHVTNFTAIGNVFENCSTDAIRLNDNDGGIIGELIIKKNTFKNIGQYAIFIGRYNVSNAVISENIFDGTGLNYVSGAITFRALTVHEDGTKILFEKNIFKNTKTIDIRIDHAATEDYDFEITLDNNEFYTVGSTIYTNTLTGVVKTNIKATNKVYDAAGELIDLATLTEGEAPRVKNATIEIVTE